MVIGRRRMVLGRRRMILARRRMTLAGRRIDLKYKGQYRWAKNDFWPGEEWF